MSSLAEKLNKKDSCYYTENNLTKIINERIDINPIAIIMVGSPGSGKSSLKKKFVKNYLGRRMDEFIDCDPDITLNYLKKKYTKKTTDDTSQKLVVDCYYNSREINDIIDEIQNAKFNFVHIEKICDIVYDSYDIIAKRKGQMINGTFVKEA